MKIEISKPHLRMLLQAIRDFKVRHGPFYKMVDKYRIYIYPSKYESLFLLKLSDTDLRIVDAGVAQG